MNRRVLVLVPKGKEPPEDLRGNEAIVEGRKTEYDVTGALRNLGHTVDVLGVQDELAVLRERLRSFDPHIVFNLLEEFQGDGYYVPFLLGYLELLRIPYTGCNPSSLILADNKPLTKKILRYHRVPTPDFFVVVRGQRVRRPARMTFPLIVKSAIEHGSVGIAQASVVETDARLNERVGFIHERIGTDAVVEQYVEGRELYQGLLGNRRLEAFPVWELTFSNLADGAWPIATEKAKWDESYQQRAGITIGPAVDLPDATITRIRTLCKRVFRILNLNGYARMDLRLAPDGRLYLLEPNPNPDLAYDTEFGDAAAAAGLDYEALVQRIVRLGLTYRR